MKFNNRIIIALLFVGSLALASCGSKQSTNITIETTVTADGPFFEGGNSFMAPVSVNLKELVKDENFKEASNVQLVSVELTVGDEQVSDLSIFNSASFQFLSDNNPMTTVAILNPLVFKGRSINLTTSDEAELMPFFEGKDFTALLDLDFTEYVEEESMSVLVKMNFKVEY